MMRKFSWMCRKATWSKPRRSNEKVPNIWSRGNISLAAPSASQAGNTTWDYDKPPRCGDKADLRFWQDGQTIARSEGGWRLAQGICCSKRLLWIIISCWPGVAKSCYVRLCVKTRWWDGQNLHYWHQWTARNRANQQSKLSQTFPVTKKGREDGYSTALVVLAEGLVLVCVLNVSPTRS